jgi:AAA family ATP:ADP antiporter
VTPERAVRLAMPVAALMVAHQIAGKAVRDATFLSARPVSDVPAIVTATALLVVGTVPLYSRLLERFGPRAVVSIGFLVSAAGHVAEWQFASGGRWAAVVIYLHVAGLSGLLLSGFWSVMGERFDVQNAKTMYGRIAASGTIGGLLGGLLVAQLAGIWSTSSALLLLATFHLGCGMGVVLLGDPPAGFASSTPPPDRSGGELGLSVLRGAPHLTTLALIVALGTAGATVADYLLKMQAVERVGTGANLLQFFATFYVVVQLMTFLAQFAVNASVRRIGLGATISTLPGGVVAVGGLGLLYPTFPIVVLLRGLESVLRGSLFRSAYELSFVPMDPVEKRRTKTFLDVTCDRSGDAVGAGIVQLLLLTGATYLTSQLLAAAIALSALGVWLSRRLDRLYLRMVERRLANHGDMTPSLVRSDAGWTVLDVTQLDHPEPARPAAVAVTSTSLGPDPRMSSLAELRSGDRRRVKRALRGLVSPGALELSEVIQLLGWNEMVPHARAVLEGAVSGHVGLLTDALLDGDMDFAIRRRIPRILSTTPDARAIAGLIEGLEDTRFEVRYQCSRALRILLTHHPELKVDGARFMAVAERELSVPPSVWHGYRLIDTVEHDEEMSGRDAVAQGQRNLEHLFSLLSAVLPAGPLNVALRGLQSADVALRSVAIEYLAGVLPPAVWSKLSRLLEVTPTASGGDAPAQSAPPQPAKPQ